jgi:hypothetical protein
MRPEKIQDREEPGDAAGGARRRLGSHPSFFDTDKSAAFDAGRERGDDIVDVDDKAGVEPVEDVSDEDDVDLGVDDEALPETIEEEPRTVLITGASGNIGRKLRAAWADVYDLVLLDAAARPDDPDVIVADLRVLDDDWITHFHGVDTVVHLAANTDELARWEDLIGPNLDALANVFHAAALAGVERVVFASSNHVMGSYRTLGDGPISTNMMPMPDGPYGISKLVGERLGKSLARAFDLTFIALRLGWIQEGKNRSDTLPDDWARQMWLSNADMIQLFDCAVEAEIEDRSFVLVHGMSRNHGMRWDLSGAAELLGFLPMDDAFAEER